MTNKLILSKPFSFYSLYYKSKLDSLEEILGLNRQFTARLELAESLTQLLKIEGNYPNKLDAILKKYLYAIDSVLDNEAGEVPKRVELSGRNPLIGKVTTYEYAAFFLFNPHNQVKKKVQIIRHIVLVALILLGSRKYKAICRRTRVALSDFPLPFAVLEALPSSISFAGKHFIVLRNQLRTWIRS